VSTKAKKPFTELVLFKGVNIDDGASLRMNELKILMRVAAELNGLEYKEDGISYALMGPSAKMHEGADSISAFRSKILSRVDLCGYFSDTELAVKVQTIVKLAQDKEMTCGVDLIKSRAQELIMTDYMSLRDWSF
jgi:hypothetical protein